MRLDRIYSEGEALNALRRMKFDVRGASNNTDLYEVEHPQLGGSRTFTVEQLCSFAEGAACLETIWRGEPATTA